MAGKKAKTKAKPAARGSKKPLQNPTSKRNSAPRKKAPAVDRVAEFVRQYVVDLNGRRAAVSAGYSPDSARFTASELMRRPEVRAAIDEALAARTARTQLAADATITRIHAIATADASEISQIHRNCCRYCYGQNNAFQRTPRELRKAQLEWEVAELARQKAGEGDPRPFDPEGGTGWDPRRDPSPTCPECFGEGEVRIVFADTRDLSPQARLLYAGVQETQHGIKVLTHDPMAMLVNLGKHQGLFRERVELTGKDGGPVAHSLASILDDIEGSDTGVGPATSRKG
jgi:phage terminase small subunit